jgi:hypothetical protein
VEEGVDVLRCEETEPFATPGTLLGVVARITPSEVGVATCVDALALLGCCLDALFEVLVGGSGGMERRDPVFSAATGAIRMPRVEDPFPGPAWFALLLALDV